MDKPGKYPTAIEALTMERQKCLVEVGKLEAYVTWKKKLDEIDAALEILRKSETEETHEVLADADEKPKRR